MQTCPNESLKLIDCSDYNDINPANKLKRLPMHDLARCTYCDICVEACPFHVLQSGIIYDSAFYTREEMVRTPRDLYRAWLEQHKNNNREEALQ